MKKMITILGNLLVSTVIMWAQAPTDIPVVFRNTGKMNISKTEGTPLEHSVVNINIVGSVKMIDMTDIEPVAFSGGIGLTGHFIQDSNGTIFKTNLAGSAKDYGFISFRGTTDQYITSSDTVNINRATSYIPFSGIEIATDKRVVVSCKMGIDASSIKLKTGKTGKMWLNSNPVGQNIFDASLRIPFLNAEVDPGSVVVERYFDNYKNTGTGGSQNSMLFPFATPFATGSQASGYFAGHWVRKTSNQYIYGDKDSNTDGIIDPDQYVIDPLEKLIPGKAYLVKPRIDSDFNANFTDGGLNLAITNANPQEYIKKKFIFDGNVYSFAPVNEILNVSGVNVPNVSTQTNAMTNVVIGNSSTSSISFSKLVNYLSNQSLPIYKYLYVYVPGANSYIPVSMLAPNATSPASLIENQDIPAMSVFIVRLPQKATTVTGNLNITPHLYTHGTNGHNLKASLNYNNEVLFRVTNQDNNFQFDLTAIGLRTGASEASDNMDVLKLSGYETGGLQLYTETTDGVKMASNSVPYSVKQVWLCAYPNNSDVTYTLTAERIESLNTQTLLLEDLKTGDIINLFENNAYTFSVNKSDDPKRFIVHFQQVTDSSTGIDDVITKGNMKAYYAENQLNIHGLRDADMNASVNIYDIQGRIIKTEKINNVPEMSIPVNLPRGVYIVRITGNKNLAVKIII